MKRRAVVVDDSAICRAQLRDWLEADGDVEVVGAAADGESAIDLINRLRPDVATIDLRLPGMSGLELLRHLRSEEMSPPVIVLGEETDVRAAVDAMREGAADFIEKQHMDLAIPRRVAYLLDRTH
jgi:chemotaxis response regulator CheB